MNDQALLFSPAQGVAVARRNRRLLCGRLTSAIRCLGILALLLSGSAAAQPDLLNEPFGVRNQNPFILVYGLPAVTAADLLPAGAASLQLQVDITNHSKTSDSAQEQVILDGETYRAALIYRRGFSDGWQWGVELPVIVHSSGFMDNFIEGWHDAFGLSNGSREPWPKNRLLFSYQRNGRIEAELTEGTRGLGDLQFQLSRRLLSTDAGRSLSLHASLKLPTGDEARLLGSGSTDMALWLSGAAPELLGRWRIGGYLQAGLLRLGEGEVLEGLRRDTVWFGTAGMHWQAWSWLTVKAQLDAHGAFYESELDQLGRGSTMLTLGVTVPVNDGAGAVDIAIGENLTTDAVPDFMINLAYRHRF